MVDKRDDQRQIKKMRKQFFSETLKLGKGGKKEEEGKGRKKKEQGKELDDSCFDPTLTHYTNTPTSFILQLNSHNLPNLAFPLSQSV